MFIADHNVSVKRFFCFIFICCLFLFGIATRTYAEEITSYNVDSRIQEDGTVVVNESITYNFGNEQRHGIFRTIPLSFRNNEGKEYRMDMSDVQVTDGQGQTYEWNRSDSSGTVELKIGDPDKTITGQQTYMISYLLSGALSYFEDHDEWYWNVTGNDWNIPIQSASAKISLPQNVDTNGLQLACYTGSYESTQSHCTFDTESHTVLFQSNQPFSEGEGLTIVVGFPKGSVAVLEPTPVTNVMDHPFMVGLQLFLVILWYVVLPLYIIYRWYKRGRDPKSTIGQANVWFAIPKFQNKEEVTPAELSLLLQESVTPKALSGTIVHLAQRGFLTIDQQEKEIFLHNTKHTGMLLPFEQKVYDAVFSAGDMVSSKKLQLNTTFTALQKDLAELSVKQGLFVKNPQKQKDFYIIVGLLGLCTLNIFLLVVCIVFGRNMPRRTQFGADLAAMGRALKAFLSSQEHQYTFQAKELLLFEKMLPYAVALGVEKLWAERFKDAQVPAPIWYSGNTFTPVLFASNLHSSFSSMEQHMSSSSSGRSSGFSGGFSGGGGGGGGGGSW